MKNDENTTPKYVCKYCWVPAKTWREDREMVPLECVSSADLDDHYRMYHSGEEEEEEYHPCREEEGESA